MFKDIAQLGLQPDTSTNDVVVVVPKDNEESSMMKQVFSIDEVTGLPRSDIGVYMDKQAHPSVRQFVKDRFLTETMVAENINVGQTDDDVINGTPNRYDSQRDFDSRVNKMLEDEKAELAAKKARKAVREKLKSLNLDS